MGRARTNKRGSLNHQISERMKELNCIGESRYLAKQEAREELGYKNNRTVGIHSYKTYEAIKVLVNSLLCGQRKLNKGLEISKM